MPMLRLTLTALIAFGLDRLSKIVIVEWLDLASVQTIPVWPPYFSFVMAWNKGVNFGFLSGFDARWFLIAFSIAISVALVVWVRNKSGWVLPLAAGAVVGGALGNAVDRVVYGAVADYLNVSCCSINNPFSFNVADVLIIVGAAVLAFSDEAKASSSKLELRKSS